MIILTATELSFVFEQTQISGNLEQFFFLHLSLQTYSNNWEDVRGEREKGEAAGSIGAGPFCSHRHQQRAIPDGTDWHSKGKPSLLRMGGSSGWRAGNCEWPGPLLGSSTCKKPLPILDFSHLCSCLKNLWAQILSPYDYSLRLLFSRWSYLSQFPLCSTTAPGSSHFQQWGLREFLLASEITGG